MELTLVLAFIARACQSWHRSGTIEQILAEYPGQVRFVYRDFPVIAPTYSRMAARTAQCAPDQGNDAFWAHHDTLFTLANARSSQADLVRLGEQLGLDTAALQACVDSNTHVATVQYDEDRGNKLGLQGTPAFFVNGQLLYFASPSGLREAIEQALN